VKSGDEPRVRFDDQAQAYEERAGLPDDVCRDVAAQLTDGLAAGAMLLDVGAGTGTLGRHLATGRVRYVGLDVSRPMLREFAAGGAPLARAVLLQADADAAWPLDARAADVILFSRSAHLLKRERTLGEVLRVAAPGARVWIGRVRRPRESPAEQLKRAMRQMLRDRGITGRDGDGAKREFLDALLARGATLLPERASVPFTEDEAPLDSLHSWRGKDGLAGRAVPERAKREILEDLERWAADAFGELAAKRPVERRYELQGVQLAG
jgi:SAM-dependent methyltransferase